MSIWLEFAPAQKRNCKEGIVRTQRGKEMEAAFKTEKKLEKTRRGLKMEDGMREGRREDKIRGKWNKEER